MPRDLTGQRFGRLVAVAREPENWKSYWVCRCDCGAETRVLMDSLVRDHTRSCGCLLKDARRLNTRTHGLSHKSPLYKTWTAVKERCYNPKSRYYRLYGGRGISLCDEWRDDFNAFLADLGDPPPRMTFDRIDNDGNYEPGNCRWATKRQQASNRANSYKIQHDGGFVSLSHFAEIHGLYYPVLAKNYKKNGSDLDAAVSKARQHKPKAA